MKKEECSQWTYPGEFNLPLFMGEIIGYTTAPPNKAIPSLMVSIPGKLEPEGIQISAPPISQNIFRQDLRPRVQPLCLVPWSWEGPSPSSWHSACLVCSYSLPGSGSTRGESYLQAPRRYPSWGTCYKSVRMPPFSLS